MKSQKQLQNELEEADKAIQYLQQKYEEETGKKLEIPISYTTFLCIIYKYLIAESKINDTNTQLEKEQKQTLVLANSSSSKYAIEADKFEMETFIDKVHDLRLPQVPYYQKKTKNSPSKISKNNKSNMMQMKETVKQRPELKYYLLDSIDLSGFENKGFSKAGLQELLKGIQNLVSVRKLLLQNNGIPDECSLEIGEFVKSQKIQYLNLSYNKLGKIAAQFIGQSLSSTSHLIWFE